MKRGAITTMACMLAALDVSLPKTLQPTIAGVDCKDIDAEYKLIKEKKSKLPAKQRAIIVRHIESQRK